jgi:hypothetical protein
MAEPRGAGAFATDLGYLEKFFDKLERHASAMADAGAKARLVALLAEERARWAEIRGLLEGGPAATPSAPNPAAKGGPPAPATAGFTVGSLVRK